MAAETLLYNGINQSLHCYLISNDYYCLIIINIDFVGIP